MLEVSERTHTHWSATYHSADTASTISCGMMAVCTMPTTRQPYLYFETCGPSQSSHLDKQRLWQCSLSSCLLDGHLFARNASWETHVFQYSCRCSDEVDYRGFSSSIFWVGFMWDYSSNAGCGDYLSTRGLVLPHKMDRELGSVNNALVVYICT